MARLIYSAITSLDGYHSDADGRFDWAAPSPEVHAYINDLERDVGTYLYGRRMYEIMVYWETVDTGPDAPAVARDFAAVWRAADKIVYSSTLTETSSARTVLESRFDPASVARLKSAAHSDLSVGGPGLAGAAIAAGLVDEIQLFTVPWVVGGGTRALPDGVRFPLTLTEERRFADGTVFTRYDVGR